LLKHINYLRRQWLNNVNNAFSGDKVLHKFFKPEVNTFRRLKEAEHADITQKRIDGMIANIKTPTKMAAIRKVFAQQQANYVASQVAKKEMAKYQTRMGAVKSFVGGAPNLTRSGIGSSLSRLRRHCEGMT